MTKALQLCRSFHAAGHRVLLVESPKYRLTGHRFSRSVDAFHTVPDPGDEGYAAALLEIVEKEDVDVYVPVCSPAASLPDARAKELLVDALRGRAPRRGRAGAARRQVRVRPRCGGAGPPGAGDPPDHRRAAGPRLRLRAGPLALHPQEHRLRPGAPARPDPPPVRPGRRDGRVRPVAADLAGEPVDPAGVRRGCRSTAPTAPSATDGCRSTAAASPRPPSSTTRWSTTPRSATGWRRSPRRSG